MRRWPNSSIRPDASNQTILNSSLGEQLIFGDFALDIETAQLLRQGRAVELRHKSFEVLRLLAENAERVVSREDLATSVWRGHVLKVSVRQAPAAAKASEGRR